MGHEDGTLACHNLTFSTVHGLYRDIYAYRERLTNVIIQQLSSSVGDVEDEDETKIKIRCHDLVKKISVYKDKLAVSIDTAILK